MSRNEVTGPLTFQPIFIERMWGGRRLESEFHKELPQQKRIGESWEIVDRSEAQSVVTGGLTYTAPWGWAVSLRGRYFSKSYQDVTAAMRLDPGAVFDASLSVPLGRAFDLTFTGENVLDRRYTAEASQGPRIGEPAVFFVGIRIHPFSSGAGKATRRSS